MAKTPKTKEPPVSGIARRRAAAKAEAGAHYLARRHEVVQAAASVFKEQGVASTSVDDIARAAGVDRATLYYYFPNKDELFREVVIEAVVSNITLAERIAASDEPAADRLSAVIAGVLASYAEFYPQFFVFIREDQATLPSSARTGVDILDLYRRFDRAIIKILKDGIEAGDFRSNISPRLAAFGIIGMLNWTYRWFDPNGPVNVDEVADTFASLAVEGLREPDRPRRRKPAAKR